MGWVLLSSCEADDVCFLHSAARDLLLIPPASRATLALLSYGLRASGRRPHPLGEGWLGQ